MTRSPPLKSHAEVDDEIAGLTSSGIHIPAQPKVVLDVTTALLSSECDFRSVSHMIGQDAGLTAMLYKVSRSAAFSRSRPPQSIEQILALVGLRQTAYLVQAYGVTAVLKNSNKQSLEHFWSRTNSIADLASLICHERLRNGASLGVSPEQAYMLGIFHDCGIPILMQRFPEYCQMMTTHTAEWPDVANHDKTLGVDHCSIGYLMARHWRLPDLIADAILGHHNLAEVETQPVRTLIAVLALATHLYSEERGFIDREWDEIGGLILEELAIRPNDLPEVSEEIFELIGA